MTRVRHRLRGWLVTVVLAAGTTAGCTTANAPPASPTAVQPPTDAVPAAVERVVDGDTLVAEVDGQRERVRLLRIDTPELARDGDPAACLAERAAAALEQLLPPGRSILLATDVEERDRFGRLLAHVWVDDRWVNGLLLERGLAQVVTFPPNVAFDDEVRAAQDRARDDARGLWDPSTC